MSIEIEILTELKSIQKRLGALIKDIEGLTVSPEHFDEEAGEKVTRFKKSKNPFFQDLKNTYIAYFRKAKGIEHSWMAKDSVAINEILNKIILSGGMTKGIVFAYPEKNTIVIDVFRAMLDGLEKNDKFTFDNLSLPLFNSRFSTIASNIKNSKGGELKNYEDELKKTMGG